MTPEMPDWFRSVTLLGTAFVAVTAATLGLAALIVPNPAASAPGPAASANAQGGGPPAGGPVTAVGGTLVVTGDREGSFVLDREATDQGYALAGEAGRIFFEGDPLAVERITYDGLEIYLDPGDCALESGERHDPSGVAGAHIRCDDVEDVRGGGVVSLDGTVGISADLLGLRGDLPPSGGTLNVGDRAVELPSAVLYLGSPANFQPAGGFLVNDDGTVIFQFDYDFETHGIEFVNLEIEGEPAEFARGSCSVTTRDIGVLNPRTTTSELTLQCPAVELASGETVQVDGTIVADLIETEE
jgi:hypothetical protein